MKKIILLFLSLLCMTASQSQIEIFNDGVLEYTTINLSKNVSVKKYNNVCPAGVFIIPETVMYNGYEYTIISVSEEAFRNCSSLTSVNIPNSVSSIGEAAFKGCSSLTSVNIPSGVTSIELDTFTDCSDLTNIIIPNTISSIGERAFAFCTGLTSINIPKSVTNIGEAAFMSCTALTSFIVNWITPLAINANVFVLVSLDTLSLMVPAGTKSVYQAALVWQDFGAVLNTSDFESTLFHVYPNPVKNQFTVQLENNNVLDNINIYNNLGQLVKESKDLTTDVISLSNGLYFLEIETNQGKLNYKIVKN